MSSKRTNGPWSREAIASLRALIARLDVSNAPEDVGTLSSDLRFALKEVTACLDVLADEVAELREEIARLRSTNSVLLEALRGLVESIERAAGAGIDLTGHIGLGDALAAIAKATGR